MNISPNTNDQIRIMSNDIWATFWKKYMNVSGHLSDEQWQEILQYADTICKKYNENPFAANLLQVYIWELQARDNGKYKGYE